MLDLTLLAQDDSTAGFLGLGFLCCFSILYLALIIVIVAGMWKMFEKGGEPGWGAIVPFYNLYILTKMSGKEILWFILLLIPCVNIVASFIVNIALAERFGKSAGFGIGMALFPFVFYPMLGFGNARYTPGKS